MARRKSKPKQLELEAKYREDGKVHIFTDGSCSTKDRSGGWGAFIVWGEKELRVSGWEDDTTIGRMELFAIMEAVQCVSDPAKQVIVYSDSQYAVKALTLWWKGWEADGWQTSMGRPVKNHRLIKRIITLVGERPIAFRWIKGHAGLYGNEQADKLAGLARRRMVAAFKMLGALSMDKNAAGLSGIELWRSMADSYIYAFDYRYKEGSADGWYAVHPIKLWSMYLIASYMYYVEAESIMTDPEFDSLCRHLLEVGADYLKDNKCYWIDTHYDTSQLAAGTGFGLINKMPISIQNLGVALVDRLAGRQIGKLYTDSTATAELQAKLSNAQAATKPPVRTRVRTTPTPPPVAEAPKRVRVRPAVATPVAPEPRTRVRVRK